MTTGGADVPTTLYRIGESKRFHVQDASCLRAACFEPFSFVNVRNGKHIYTCETRAVQGCPAHEDRGWSIALHQRRKADNWQEEPIK